MQVNVNSTGERFLTFITARGCPNYFSYIKELLILERSIQSTSHAIFFYIKELFSPLRSIQSTSHAIFFYIKELFSQQRSVQFPSHAIVRTAPCSGKEFHFSKLIEDTTEMSKNISYWTCVRNIQCWTGLIKD